MAITVVDTHSAMERILRAPAEDRTSMLQSMLEPVRGMYRFFSGDVDLVDIHHQSSGFPLDRDEERCRAALETLRDAHAWERMQGALDDALAVQMAATPWLEIPDITVVFLLGDPGDPHFMGPTLGITGFGGLPGYITITLWPFPENVERLEATAVHELNHNLRFGPGGVVWDPATVTVGEYVISEGLADAFARQIYGDEIGYTRMGVPHLHDDEVFAKVVSGLDVTGMQNFTAWVHGDAHAERFGATPVGLPTGAGYSVGNRLVDEYLAETGQTAAQAFNAEAAEVIATVLNRGG